MRRLRPAAGVSPSLALLALTGTLSLACGAFPQLTCGPGTVERDHQCVLLSAPVNCGPGTVLSGYSCMPEPAPVAVVPEKDRIISDLHGLTVPVPGDLGLGSWMFSYPTEFHALVVEKTTEAGDVLQLDTRVQLEDFNTHAHFTVWMTLLYTRELSAWRFESATITAGVHEWVERLPAPPPVDPPTVPVAGPQP